MDHYVKYQPYSLYPLPEDYEDLTFEGQKAARLAVLHRQDTSQHLVEAWNFFRRVYLGGVGPLFYKNGFEESPDFHYQMVYDLGKYARNADAAPRGSAKSTVIGLEIPLLLSLTRPHYEMSLGLATDVLIRDICLSRSRMFLRCVSRVCVVV